jgi:hypothetical protein
MECSSVCTYCIDIEKFFPRGWKTVRYEPLYTV